MWFTKCCVFFLCVQHSMRFRRKFNLIALNSVTLHPFNIVGAFIFFPIYLPTLCVRLCVRLCGDALPTETKAKKRIMWGHELSNNRLLLKANENLYVFRQIFTFLFHAVKLCSSQNFCLFERENAITFVIRFVACPQYKCNVCTIHFDDHNTVHAASVLRWKSGRAPSVP